MEAILQKSVLDSAPSYGSCARSFRQAELGDVADGSLQASVLMVYPKLTASSGV
jgi:hypothetical protein